MLLFALGIFFGSFLGVTALAIAKASQDSPDVIRLTDREQTSGRGPTQGEATSSLSITPQFATF